MDFLKQLDTQYKSLKFPNMDSKQLYKTGTTCIAFKFKDGIILASERKVSIPEASMVWEGDKKISAITEYVSLGGAGTAIGLQYISNKILPLITTYYKNSSNRQIDLEQIKNYLCYALLEGGLSQFYTFYILAGMTNTKHTRIYSFDSIGATTEHTTYFGMGSGYRYASAILDLEHNNDLTKDEAIALAQKAVGSSKRLDLYSGYTTDIHVITAEGTEFKVIESTSP